MSIRVGFGHVYLISDGEYTKVGFSTDPEKRLKQLQTAHPKKLKLVGLFEADREVETLLHEELTDHHVRGEWYDLGEAQYFTVLRVLEELGLES